MSELQDERLWTRSFIAITLAYCCLFLNLHLLLSPSTSYVQEQFRVSDGQISLVTSLFAFSAIATRFATAWAMKRVRPVAIMYAGLGIAAMITFAYSWAGSFEALLLLRIGYGVGFGMASVVMPTFVAELIPARRMGEGIGYFGLSTSIAMSVGPLIGLEVMKLGFGYLTVLGGMVVLAAFPLLLPRHTIPASAFRLPEKKDKDGHKGDAPRSGAVRKLLLPASLNLLVAITFGGLVSFLALFGKTVHLSNVGLFFLVNALSMVAVRPISGKLFDRKGSVAVLVPGGALAIIGLLVLSGTNGPGMLIAAAVLYGTGYGMIQPAIQAWMIHSVKPQERGMANSLFYNSLDFGIAAGSLLLGVIASMTGYAGMYRLSSVIMVLFIAVTVLSAVVSRQAARTKEPSVEA